MVRQRPKRKPPLASSRIKPPVPRLRGTRLATCRSLAFLVDLALVLLLILGVESLIGLVVLYFTEVQLLAGGTDHNYLLISDIHLLLIPTLLALAASSLMSGRSPGSRLFGIRTTWVLGGYADSIFACLLRSFAFFSPVYLYFWLAALPHALAREADAFPFLELCITLFLLLAIPISVALGGGSQGIHDRVLRTSVQWHPVIAQESKVAHAPANLGYEIAVPTVAAILLAVIIESSGVASHLLAKYLGQYRHMHSESLARGDAAIAERIAARLKQPDVASLAMRSSFGVTLSEPPPSIYGRQRAGDTMYPTITVWIGGAALRNSRQTENTLFTALSEVPDLVKFDRLLVRFKRQIDLDLFALSIDSECYFPGNSPTVVTCFRAYQHFVPLLSWGEGLRHVE